MKPIRTKTGVRRLGSAAGRSAAVGNALSALAACLEYSKTMHHEHTERERIVAQRDAALAAIAAHKEVLLAYFHERFAERRQALAGFFDLLEESARTNNETIVDRALQGIITIIRENPLRDFATFSRNMKNPAFELEL
jgi:hypothetical protein